jgi:ubiquitin carboxyl-terminal hydrolase 8
MPSTTAASKLGELHIAKSFQQLCDQFCGTETFDSKKLNELSTCNSILKLYDEAQQAIDVDQERAYIYLCRFVDLSIKMRKTNLYKTDKVYIENLLSIKKINSAMARLESLKESLIKRYEQLYTGEDSVEHDSSISEQPQPTKNPINMEVKKFVTPTDMIAIIKCKTFKLLIVDIRNKTDYDKQHIKFDYIDGYDASRVDYVNLDDSLIDISTNVIWKLEDKLNKLSVNELSACIKNRAVYDYLILMDSNSTESTLTNSTKLVIFKNAIFQYESKLKNEPIILNGGWSEWITYYPASTTSIQTTVAPDTSSTNNSLLKIQYPDVETLKITEAKDVKTVQQPTVDRSIKPAMSTSDPINAREESPVNNGFSTVTSGRINIDDLKGNISYSSFQSTLPLVDCQLFFLFE